MSQQKNLASLVLDLKPVWTQCVLDQDQAKPVFGPDLQKRTQIQRIQYPPMLFWTHNFGGGNLQINFKKILLT